MNKKIIIIILIVIILAAGAFFIYNHNNKGSGNETQMINYVQNGVSFSYPEDWGVSKATSNYSIAAICLKESISSNKVAEVNILVEKHNFTGNFDDFVNKTYTSIAANESFNLTSYGSVHIGGNNATQVDYTSYINGTVKMHRAIWFEHGEDAYVVMYSAPESEFDKHVQVFEYFISTFKITA